jgi:hypothetical protein
MTDPVADVARSAAVILAADLSPNLPADVEAALAVRDNSGHRPDRYDPAAIAGLGTGAASLVVSIAQLAWSVYSDRRNQSDEPSPDSITRRVRMTLRDQDTALLPGTERITEVVVTVIVSQASTRGT